MSIHNLDKIFNPASIAIIGASEREGSIGCSLLNNIMKGDYQGEVFPVNPRHKIIKELQAYRSI